MNQDELDRFIAWLLAHGSEVLAPTNPYEVVRFTTQDGVAIIFKDADGEITKDRNGAFGVLRCFRKKRNWNGGGKRDRKPRSASRRRLLVNSIAKRDGWNCMYCGATLTLETATIEHIVPLAGNGLDDLRNMTLACATCNREAGHLSARQKVELAMKKRGDVMKPEADMYDAEREGVDRTIPDEPEYHGPRQGAFLITY